MLYTTTKLDGTWYYVLDPIAAHAAMASEVSGGYPTRRTAEDAARLALGITPAYLAGRRRAWAKSRADFDTESNRYACKHGEAARADFERGWDDAVDGAE